MDDGGSAPNGGDSSSGGSGHNPGGNAPGVSQRGRERTAAEIETLANLTSAAIYSSGLNLSVDVFHINVEGKGDAAVHLLIHQDRTFAEPFILRAVLIDGGLRSGAEKIKVVLRNIAQEYDFDTQQGGREKLDWPPFDSIVITHWDEDHFQGVVELLHGDLAAKYTASNIVKPTKPAGKASKDQANAYEQDYQKYVADLETFTSGYLSPYMKYAAGTPAPPSGADTPSSSSAVPVNTTPVPTAKQSRGDRAMTILYCPYFGSNKTGVVNNWHGISPSHYFSNEDVTSSEGFKQGLSCGEDYCGQSAKIWPFYAGATDTRDRDGPNMPSRFLDFNVNHFGAGFGPYAESAKTWARKVCKIRAGNRYLLGTNLFTHWRLDVDECYAVKNPLQLALAHVTPASFHPDSTDPLLNKVKAEEMNKIDRHHPDNAQPLLLIVGANGDVCGMTVTGKSPQVPDDNHKDQEPTAEQEAGISDSDKFWNWSEARPAEPLADASSVATAPTSSDGGQAAPFRNDTMGDKARLTRKLNSVKPESTQDRTISTFETVFHQPKMHLKIVNDPTGRSKSEFVNTASIITLAVWTDGHMSHYSAGDAQWELEDKVVAWIQSGENPFQCIRAVKLSHHGSGSSTPLDLIRKFRPRSIVASASGRDYGHPSYELLIYLNRWFRTSNRIVPSGASPGKLFHTLTYPYYLPYIIPAVNAPVVGVPVVGTPDGNTSDAMEPADDNSDSDAMESSDGKDSDDMDDDDEKSPSNEAPIDGSHGKNADDMESDDGKSSSNVPRNTGNDGSNTNDGFSPKPSGIGSKRVAILAEREGFSKNFWHGMLSSDVKGHRARQDWIDNLKLLESRLPADQRCLELYAAEERALARLRAAKIHTSTDVEHAKQNFTLRVVEEGMPVMAYWHPESSLDVVMTNAALGTLLPAYDKVQYAKIHCRSWSQKRRLQDIEPRLDGSTDVVSERSERPRPRPGKEASRKAGIHRGSGAAAKAEELKLTAKRLKVKLKQELNSRGLTVRGSVVKYNRQKLDVALAVSRRHTQNQLKYASKGTRKPRGGKNTQGTRKPGGGKNAVSKRTAEPRLQSFEATTSNLNLIISANGSHDALQLRSAASTASAKIATGDTISPPLPVPGTDMPQTYNLVPSELLSTISSSLIDNSVVPISISISEYCKFLFWISSPMLTVDSEGSVVPADDFRGHLLRALNLNQDTSKLQALFAANTKVRDGVWTGLSLDCVQAGHQLRFTTADAVSYFTSGPVFAHIPSYKPPATGLIMQLNALVMACQPAPGSTPDQWNFTDILTWLGLLAGSDTSDAISELEDVIGTGVKFDFVRGAVWFCPEMNYGTVQRMEWRLDAPKVRAWLAKGFVALGSDITIDVPTIVGRKITRHTVTSAGDLFIDKYEFLIAVTLVRPVGITAQSLTTTIQVDLEHGGTSLTISLLPSSGTLGDMLGWITDVFGEKDSGITDIVNSIPGFDSTSLKRVELKCSKEGLLSFGVDMEWRPGWKNVDPNDPKATGVEIPFLLKYHWMKSLRSHPHLLSAQIWYEDSHVRDPRAAPTEVSPFYEPTRIIRPSVPAPSSVHLQSLMPGSYQLPKELSLMINELVVSLDEDTISFSGQLVAANLDNTGDTGFGIQLEAVTLKASYTRGDPPTGQFAGLPQPKGESSYSLSLEAEIDITPPAEEAIVDNAMSVDNESARTVIIASASLEAHGASKVCRLHGFVKNLNLAILGRFFPAEDAQVVTDILGHITLDSLDFDYLYDTSGVGSQFDMTAKLILGPCELDVDFHRDSDGWRFDALLQAADGTNATVGAILEDILGDDDAAYNSIPGFVKDMSLSGGAAFVSFNLASLDGASLADNSTTPAPAPATKLPALKYFMMNLTVRVPVPGGAGVELSFVQLTEKPVIAVGTMAPAVPPGTLRNKTKRVIRASVVDLPWHKIPNPPVVGQIQPLFEELQFLWVQDPISNAGVSRKEISMLGQITQIQFKDTFRQPKPEDVVLVAGMHFCIADASKVLLDYAFNKPPAQNTTKLAVVSKDNKPLPAPGAPLKGASGDGSSTGELSKKVGPISVSNVGVRFEDNVLFLFFDIEAHLGPVEVMLLGFGIGVNLKDFNLQKIYDISPQFQLKGMGISFEQPPVGIAGMFKDASNATQRLYMGGVAITFAPYSFMAVGEYGEIARPGTTGLSDTYKTLFIFAKLEGPLIELEFVTIGGITLGFGYNSNLRFPTIDQVPSFPFIANTVGGGNVDPLTVMNQLVGSADSYVKPQENSFWLAAGLQAKAFQAVDVSAVVVLEFSPYVNLGIFAKAIAQMPPEPTPRQACFLYVELGLMCTVDFHAGAFRVEAQLSPNSFVIHPSCHLTGGFAMCYWFAASPYAGDFVFTVGGYHPVYKPPPHYPVPPRLGISWQLGQLSITGEAYFAITPTCCMGGGRLEVVFSAGLLCAYLTAYADFLIVYNPFFFQGQIGVCVGVRFTLDLLFVTIHISVELSARLQLQGPEFGGEAYVDFWVFGFTIPFGAQPNKPEKKTLDGFLDLLLKVPDADSVAQANSITNGQTAGTAGTIDKLHVLSVEAGRYTDKKTSKDGTSPRGAIWEVKRAGFQFRVQSRVPLQTITEPAASENEPDLVVQEENAFYSKPMQLTEQLQSTMTVTITKFEKNGHEVATFIPTPVIKAVPSALWGIYDSAKDPSSGSVSASTILSPSSSDGTIPLVMGATFSAPLPWRSYDRVLKYNILLSSSLDVFTLADVDTNGKLLHPYLPAETKVSSGNWTAGEPKAGAEQWKDVEETWQKAVQTQVDGGDGGEGQVGLVDSVIDIMTSAMGWGNVEAGNGLQNDLGQAEETLLWRQFEQLYMAAPMIAVGN